MRELLILFPVLLGACATRAQAPQPPPTALCNDSGLAVFIGQRGSVEVRARMLAQSGARLVRWVAFGSMITMEYSPERLTVVLDQNNRVESARCG